jgi:hypothetical protein
MTFLFGASIASDFHIKDYLSLLNRRKSGCPATFPVRYCRTAPDFEKAIVRPLLKFELR